MIIPDSLFTVQVFKICFAVARIMCDGTSWATGYFSEVLDASVLLVLTTISCEG